MEEIKLEKNARAFRMSDGKMFIVSDDDYKELVKSITMEMLVNGDNRVYLIKDVVMQRAKLMQQIYNESKGDMNDITKNKYLQEILNVLKENDYKIITFEEEKNASQNSV